MMGEPCLTDCIAQASWPVWVTYPGSSGSSGGQRWDNVRTPTTSSSSRTPQSQGARSLERPPWSGRGSSSTPVVPWADSRTWWCPTSTGASSWASSWWAQPHCWRSSWAATRSPSTAMIAWSSSTPAWDTRVKMATPTICAFEYNTKIVNKKWLNFYNCLFQFLLRMGR